MKTIKVLKITLVAFISFFLSTCGTESLLLPVIIGLSATWQDSNDPDHRIELRPNSENTDVSSGVFVGREFHDTDDIKDDNLIIGSFNGLDIEMTILRRKVSPDTELYLSGKVITVSDTDFQVVRVEVNSSEGLLVLTN